MSTHFTWNLFSLNCNNLPGKLLAIVSLPLMLGCQTKMTMDWKTVPPIPPRKGMSTQFGMAGPVSGADGNFVLLAGGANFENGLPWRGGIKRYHDEIYLLEANADGTFSWKVSGQRLPFAMAYAACVPLENGFVGIGGETDHGALNNVIRYTFADGNVKMDSLPELPVSVTSAAATRIGETIFVMGGLDPQRTTNRFFCLQLDHLSNGWNRLQDLPVRLSHAVAVAQWDGKEQSIYLFGGRNKTAELTTFFSSVWKFSPALATWQPESEITLDGHLINLAAGTGFAFGKNQIVLLGGDRGILFNKTERFNLDIENQKEGTSKESLLKQKDEFLMRHPGFSRQILVYDTESKRWKHAGEMEGDSPATTVVFPWKDQFVVPSGEIRPGVRSDRMILVKPGWAR